MGEDAKQREQEVGRLPMEGASSIRGKPRDLWARQWGGAEASSGLCMVSWCDRKCLAGGAQGCQGLPGALAGSCCCCVRNRQGQGNKWDK